MNVQPKLKQRNKKEKIPLRVIKGGLVPANKFAEENLRKKKYKVGDILFAVITKPRNPKFNGLVHGIGKLCIEHISDFSKYVNAHDVIKRLQLEGNICCDEIAISPPQIVSSVLKIIKPVLELLNIDVTEDGLFVFRIPRSLSFDSMDEAEFNDAAKSMCRHITDKYWPSMTVEQIEVMAERMVNE